MWLKYEIPLNSKGTYLDCYSDDDPSGYVIVELYTIQLKIQRRGILAYGIMLDGSAVKMATDLRYTQRKHVRHNVYKALINLDINPHLKEKIDNGSIVFSDKDYFEMDVGFCDLIFRKYKKVKEIVQ